MKSPVPSLPQGHTPLMVSRLFFQVFLHRQAYTLLGGLSSQECHHPYLFCGKLLFFFLSIYRCLFTTQSNRTKTTCGISNWLMFLWSLIVFVFTNLSSADNIFLKHNFLFLTYPQLTFPPLCSRWQNFSLCVINFLSFRNTFSVLTS